MDKNNNIIFSVTLNQLIIPLIINYIISNYQGYIAVSTTNRKYGILGGSIDIQQKDISEVISFENLKNIKDIVQIHSRHTNEPLSLKLKDELSHMFRDDIAAFSNVHNVDIVKKGVDKCHGVDFILKLHHDNSQPIVIGDSYNDLEMIKRYN